MLAVVVLAVAAGPVAAASPETEAARAKIAELQREVTDDLDVLATNSENVQFALFVRSLELKTKEGELRAAREQVAEAEARLRGARASEEQARRRLAQRRADLRNLAIEAYIDSGPRGIAVDLLSVEEMSDLQRRRQLNGVAGERAADVVSGLDTARTALAGAKARAESAANESVARRAEVDTKVREVAKTKAYLEVLRELIADRIGQRLEEAYALAALDAQWAARFALEEALLAAKAKLPIGPTAFGVPIGFAPLGPIPPMPTSLVGRGITLATVRGIRVNSLVAANLTAMLTAAETAGIRLGGGGYRDPQSQWRLRVAHCPDPVNSRSSACSPPTAPVGRSMHQLGLAIDFTHDGKLIASRADAGYQWLAANAARYGFFNLPSEPWHWSVNGQ